MSIRALIHFFDCEEGEILTQADELYKILTHLRYEGKVSRGKNVKGAIQVMQGLRCLIAKHQELQEKVVFPFLVTHIPKHETFVRFLRADHQEMNASRLKLEAALRVLAKNLQEGFQSKSSQELGVYFVCLLHHHIQLENKWVHQAIQNELRKDEQMEVKKRVDRWQALHQKGDASQKRPRLKASAKKTAGPRVRKKTKR